MTLISDLPKQQDRKIKNLVVESNLGVIKSKTQHTMKVDHIFNLADELVFSKTGKHLDDLQRIILEGTLQWKKYAQIATENQYSDNYIK